MKLSKSITLILLLLIILMGTGLRLYRLGAEDLWLDEIYTIERAKTPWSTLTLPQFAPRVVTHFLFDFVIMHVWLKLGETATTIRLFSALVGIMSILVLYFVGKLLFDARIGLFGAGLLTLSSYHIYYSQEARAYALQVLFILGMVYFFYRGSDAGKPKFWLAFAGIALFAIYLQAFSVFSWIALNVYFIVRLCLKRNKPKIVPWLISQGVICLGCLPYFVYLLNPSTSDQLIWIPHPSVQNISSTFELFSLGKVANELPATLRHFLVPLFLFLLLVSIFKFRSSPHREKISLDLHPGTMLAWHMFAIPFILFYIISFQKPIFLPDRYLIITLPFFYLLYAHYHTVKKKPWSQVSKFLETNIQQNEIILISPDYWKTALDYYVKSPIPIKPIHGTQELLTEIGTHSAGYSRIWVVTVTDWVNKPPAELHNILQQKYRSHQLMFNLTKPSIIEVTLYFDQIR
ncbi:MAG: glycosyltransferase family 39 protein [bacterium]|nr:glycosyltransferase family 39 protein [bacterium]